MMLLSAVLLILGLLALAGMVSRVSQLSSQAGREQDRPLLREIEPMMTGLDGAISRLGTDFGAGMAPGTSAHQNATVGLLAHLRQLEASRGMVMEWTLTCTNGNPTTGGVAVVTLGDGELSVTLQAKLFKRPSCTVLKS